MGRMEVHSGPRDEGSKDVTNIKTCMTDLKKKGLKYLSAGVAHSYSSYSQGSNVYV